MRQVMDSMDQNDLAREQAQTEAHDTVTGEMKRELGAKAVHVNLCVLKKTKSF
ncbi:MAG: hypothetical protein WCP01_02410 [Methylococcaceae bacterium]|jgi:hypothetical protein